MYLRLLLSLWLVLPGRHNSTTLIALYQARFSVEFPFRDAKQFAGLSGYQSRQVEALHFHWEMALMVVWIAELSQLRDQ